MADSPDVAGAAGEQETVELLLTVRGTHAEREDVKALLTWLRNAPALSEAWRVGDLRLDDVDLQEGPPEPADTLAGEIVQAVLLAVAMKGADVIIESAWQSALTWLRNRRRLVVDEEEAPDVAFVDQQHGPDSGLSRDSARDAVPEEPLEPGGEDRARGGDDHGEA
ncbi:hypothetical protein [Streptomyces sp. LN785]|uniref:hypothetical protein n=1 Tax=Streptomyces sp. LN785 TaxID=3112983 RepID=UPI003714E33A